MVETANPARSATAFNVSEAFRRSVRKWGPNAKVSLSLLSCIVELRPQAAPLEYSYQKIRLTKVSNRKTLGRVGDPYGVGCSYHICCRDVNGRSSNCLRDRRRRGVELPCRGSGSTPCHSSPARPQPVGRLHI